MIKWLPYKYASVQPSGYNESIYHTHSNVQGDIRKITLYFLLIKVLNLASNKFLRIFMILVLLYCPAVHSHLKEILLFDPSLVEFLTSNAKLASRLPAISYPIIFSTQVDHSARSCTWKTYPAYVLASTRILQPLQLPLREQWDVEKKLVQFYKSYINNPQWFIISTIFILIYCKSSTCLNTTPLFSGQYMHTFITAMRLKMTCSCYWRHKLHKIMQIVSVHSIHVVL